MPLATCPPEANLERLFLGGLPEKIASDVEQHVLECGPCLSKLKRLLQSKETLAGVLGGETRTDAASRSPVVKDLIKKLESLQPATSKSLPPETTMITFVCSGCRKELSAKEELAGKKVKCRACGQTTQVPGKAAVPAGKLEDMKTLAPNANARSVAGNTRTPSASGEKTRSGSGAPDVDPSLTDFLAPPQADDELGRLGGFRILKVLGSGGMGVVFQGEDPKLGRSVAIKAMLPHLADSKSSQERFLREARAAAALEHDHIVPIFHVGEDRGAPFIVMPFLKGEPLDARLQREEKLPLKEVLRIGREIAEGLAAAHERGLVHRDIKPANVWLESRGQGSGARDQQDQRLVLTPHPSPLTPYRVKILDFGLARAASGESGLTQQGAIIGTPAYMAPEQAQGNPVDARSDLFSLGVVLYRLASGQLPFKGKDTVSTLMEVATQSPPPPAELSDDIPEELSRLIMKLLEKDPAKRISSAAVVAKRLAAMERGEGGRGSRDTRRLSEREKGRRGEGQRRKERARGPLVAVGIAAALLVLGGIITAAVILLRTGDGEYVVETDDPDFCFQVNKNGGVTLEDRKTKHTYQLKVLKHDKNEYELEVTDPDADLVFQTKTFTIRRGEKVALTASFKPKGSSASLAFQGISDEWLKEVADKPAEDQVKAVMAKLIELNPKFDGKETHVCGKVGVVTELQFVTDNVLDISPVRALKGLQVLNIAGTYEGKRQFTNLEPLKGLELTRLTCYLTGVTNLTPLKGMKLTHLYIKDTPLADLSPLAGMPLVEMDCTSTNVKDLTPLKDTKLSTLLMYNTPVEDLTPLKDLKLATLSIARTKVTDLSPLKDMKLHDLHCATTGVADLKPLKDMMLSSLDCGGTLVTDLAPLQNMKLAYLGIADTQVADLSPLKNMKLRNLDAWNTAVTDLSPLKDMPLSQLRCPFKPERDAAILRSISTLETLNGKPAKESLPVVSKPVDEAWLKIVADMPAEQQVKAVMTKLMDLNAGFDGKETHASAKAGVITELNLNTDHVTDITPLRALTGLQKLNINGTPVGGGKLADLSPLNGLKLTDLGCSWNPGLGDLSPLTGMPLTTLGCASTSVSDLTPLKDMKLTNLSVGGSRVADLTPLKGMMLTQLDCTGSRVADLTPLQGMKQLTWLGINRVPVADVAPLKGMNLKYLNCEYSLIADLKPLEGMNLTYLNCSFTKVTELTPLKGMKLEELHCAGTKIADLTPLQGMPLTLLGCGGTQVSDLTPLKDMPLTNLYVDRTKVADLKPLIGLRLNVLDCTGAKVTDLTPLKELPLKQLGCDYKPERDRNILGAIDTLEAINGKPAKEVLK